MKDGPVRSEILRIAHEQEIPAHDVYVVDASRQTKRISANVAGLGPTVRIALNDNLLNRSNIHGIKAVMGHEMGHYKLHHIVSLLAYLVLMAAAGLFILWWAAPRILAAYGDRWGVRSIADPASAALLSILGGLLGVGGAWLAAQSASSMLAGYGLALGLPLWGVPLCLGAALAIGLLSAVIPAASASRMKITEALRHAG